MVVWGGAGGTEKSAYTQDCLSAHPAHLESCVLRRLPTKLWDTCEICNVLEGEAPLQNLRPEIPI